MSFDLPALVHVVRRWWWLLLLAPLAGGGAMYFYGKSQQPMYRATAVLWVQMPPGSEGPDPSVIQGDINLAEMYRYLVTVEPVLSPVIDDLKLPYSVDALRGHLAVNVVRSTPLLEISATDTDPERATAIADAVTRRFSDTIGQLGVQDAPTAAATVGATTATNLAVRIVAAEVPQEPYAPRTTLFVLLGAALGLLAAGGLIALAEVLRRYAATRVKTTARMHDAPRGSLPPALELQTSRD